MKLIIGGHWEACVERVAKPGHGPVERVGCCIC